MEKIEEILPEVKKNILLASHTTYKIGGPAKCFFKAKSRNDLLRALDAAKKLKLPVFVLGGGSNILVSDKGFNGLVIKIGLSDTDLHGKEATASAGANLTKFANVVSGAGLSGLEWAVGIPAGTVGGAVYGHAQAFGEKISDCLKSVEAINLKTLRFKKLTKKQCQFSIKNSVFKKNKNWVIVSVDFIFKKKSPVLVRAKIKNNIDYRKRNHPLDVPSAGSVFVNPEKQIKNKKLLEEFPELKEYNKNGIMASGFLISRCGLAGKKIGKAQISPKHANFIVNTGGAKARDVLRLIKLAQKKVKEKFGINLEMEVQLVGFKRK